MYICVPRSRHRVVHTVYMHSTCILTMTCNTGILELAVLVMETHIH